MVYDPILREMLAASAGCGADFEWSRDSCVAEAVVANGGRGHCHSTHGGKFSARADSSVRSTQGTLPKGICRPTDGSASLQLAYVAAGRLDGYWEVGRDINDWLAGSLLVHEAGGRVTNFIDGAISTKADGIIATSFGLHEPIRQALQKRPMPDLINCAAPKGI
jgi:myo-inositol-1(or 4)-monophosphatase